MSKLKTKDKVTVIAILVIYGLFLLALASIILEGTGTFVGRWLNRPVADVYVAKYYPDIKYDVISSYYASETEEYLGFEIKTKGYCYECRVKSLPEGAYGSLKTGNVFKIKSYNFNVYYDEIYSVYACDTGLSNAINEYLFDAVRDFFSGKDCGFTPFDLYADTMPKAGKYTDPSQDANMKAAVADGVVNGGDIVLYVTGENVGFDEYKRVISIIVDFYAEGAPGADPLLVPRNLQIFYYHEDESGEKVALYESEFTSAELKFTRDMVAVANDIHYKMIPDDSEVGKMTAYNVVRIVYISVILVLVVGLSGLWVFRKVRKTIKQGIAEAANLEMAGDFENGETGRGSSEDSEVSEIKDEEDIKREDGGPQDGQTD